MILDLVIQDGAITSIPIIRILGMMAETMITLWLIRPAMAQCSKTLHLSKAC